MQLTHIYLSMSKEPISSFISKDSHRFGYKGTNNLNSHISFILLGLSGGGERIRTDDLLRAKQALSQLSYTPNHGGPNWT